MFLSLMRCSSTVEQPPVKGKVAGSSPAAAAMKRIDETQRCFFFFLHGYKISAKTALMICGYGEHPLGGSYIRTEGFGRFHAKIRARDVIEIHYDLYIGKEHFAANAPRFLTEEKKRVVKRLSKLERVRMTKDRFTRLLSQWR
jgi:hypothetical protein